MSIERITASREFLVANVTSKMKQDLFGSKLSIFGAMYKKQIFTRTSDVGLLYKENFCFLVFLIGNCLSK